MSEQSVRYYIQEQLKANEPEFCLARVYLLVEEIKSLPADVSQVERVNLTQQLAQEVVLLAQKEVELLIKKQSEQGNANLS